MKKVTKKEFNEFKEAYEKLNYLYTMYVNHYENIFLPIGNALNKKYFKGEDILFEIDRNTREIYKIDKRNED